MKMKSCVVVCCSQFNSESHRHFQCILFEMADGQVVQWNNPSQEVVLMTLIKWPSLTSLVYEHCNQT